MQNHKTQENQYISTS